MNDSASRICLCIWRDVHVPVHVSTCARSQRFQALIHAGIRISSAEPYCPCLYRPQKQIYDQDKPTTVTVKSEIEQLEMGWCDLIHLRCEGDNLQQSFRWKGCECQSTSVSKYSSGKRRINMQGTDGVQIDETHNQVDKKCIIREISMYLKFMNVYE